MNIPVLTEANVSTTNVLPTPQQSTKSPVGHALGQLGGAMEGAGDELSRLIHTEHVKANSSVVTGRITALNTGRLALLNDPKNGLLQKLGDQAIGKNAITPIGMEAFNKLYSQAEDGLTPEQLALFRQHTEYDPKTKTSGVHNDVHLQLMRHEAAQGKVSQQVNAGALVASDQQLLSTLYRDPVAFDKQLKVTKAHELDRLHFHGIADDSPAAVDALQKITSSAWAENINSLMSENPAQAKHLFELHQDELEPSQRIAIGQRVKSTSDKVLALTESTRLNSTFGPDAKLKADTLAGGKQYHGNVKLAPFDFQGMMAIVRKEHSDNPELVEHIRATLNEMKQEHADAAKEQRDTNTDYTYGALRKGRPASEVYASRQFQELSGTDQKHIQDYVRTLEHEAERNVRERKSDRRAARQDAREARQDAYELFLGTHSPDEIAQMPTADIQHKVARLGPVNMTKLLNLKKQYGSDEKKLETDKAEEQGLKEEMVKAGYDWVDNRDKNPDQRRTYGKALDRVTLAIREEGKNTGKPVSPERKREIYKEQLLTVHITKKGYFGTQFGASVDRPMFEVEPYSVKVEGAKPEDVVWAVHYLNSKGIKNPSYDVIQNAVKALLKK